MHTLNLVFRNSEKRGERIPIETDRFIIGRHSACHLVLDGNAVSRRHCVILYKEGDLVLRDLGSRNGTAVNKRRIPREEHVQIFHGDKIQIGKWKLRVSLRDSVTGKSIRPATDRSNEDPVDSNGILAELDSMLSGLEEIPVKEASGHELAIQLTESMRETESSSEDTLIADASQTETWRLNQEDLENDHATKQMPGEPKDDFESEERLAVEENTPKPRFSKLPKHLRKGASETSQDAAKQAIKRLFGGY